MVQPPEVIFVDDEAAIRLTLSAILQQNGFHVSTAASVAEALELIGRNRYDVLLSDLNIGEPGDGFTVVSAMRRLQPGAACFILTGYPDFVSALAAIRNQVDDYFTKPAEVKSLVATIRQRLEGGKPEPRHPRLRRVSDVLREHTQSICDYWLEAVHQDNDLSRVSLRPAERMDLIPSILQELIERVDREGEDTRRVANRAEQYGRARCHQGYTIPQLVLEYRLLQKAVTTTVQTNLLEVDLSTLIPDLVEIGESLASLLEISVRAFQADYEKPPQPSRR
jgi:DNA-binding response OmpR family regulator